MFDVHKTSLIVLPPACGVKFFSFPDTVCTIQTSALEGVDTLEVVFIPTSVNTIQDYAFRYCAHLQYINLPSNITYIGSNVFEGCRNLQCGLAIENTTLTSHLELIKTALLPRTCLQPCLKQCQPFSQRHISQYFLFVVIPSLFNSK